MPVTPSELKDTIKNIELDQCKLIGLLTNALRESPGTGELENANAPSETTKRKIANKNLNIAHLILAYESKEMELLQISNQIKLNDEKLTEQTKKLLESQHLEELLMEIDIEEEKNNLNMLNEIQRILNELRASHEKLMEEITVLEYEIEELTQSRSSIDQALSTFLQELAHDIEKNKFPQISGAEREDLCQKLTQTSSNISKLKTSEILKLINEIRPRLGKNSHLDSCEEQLLERSKIDLQIAEKKSQAVCKKATLTSTQSTISESLEVKNKIKTLLTQTNIHKPNPASLSQQPVISTSTNLIKKMLASQSKVAQSNQKNTTHTQSITAKILAGRPILESQLVANENNSNRAEPNPNKRRRISLEPTENEQPSQASTPGKP